MIPYDKIIEDIILQLQDELKLAKELEKVNNNQFYFGMQEGLSFAIKAIKQLVHNKDDKEIDLINKLNDNTKELTDILKHEGEKDDTISCNNRKESKII